MERLNLKEYNTNPFNDIAELYQIWDNTLDYECALALTLGKLFSYDMKDVKKLRKRFRKKYRDGYYCLVYRRVIDDRGLHFDEWLHSFINSIEEADAFFRGIHTGVSVRYWDSSVSSVSHILSKTWEIKKWSLEYLESKKNYLRDFARFGREVAYTGMYLFFLRDGSKNTSPDEAINLLVEDIEKYERSCGPSGRKIEID